jgi:hypothetical protein
VTAAEIAQLAIILAPIASNLAVEGGKVIATYRENIAQEQLNTAIELSRSATWPELDFTSKPSVQG